GRGRLRERLRQREWRVEDREAPLLRHVLRRLRQGLGEREHPARRSEPGDSARSASDRGLPIAARRVRSALSLFESRRERQTDGGREPPLRRLIAERRRASGKHRHARERDGAARKPLPDREGPALLRLLRRQGTVAGGGKALRG